MSNTKGAEINIRALCEFNVGLESFESKLRDSLMEMKKSISVLEKDWKDEKFTEFKVPFEGHAKKLDPLANELKRYKEYSEKEWMPIIERYFNQKM
jgi:hypothetical protein